MGVHELSQARVREDVRRGHPSRAPLEGQVRAADRVADQRLHQRARALRHDEGGPQPGQQGLRRRHVARLAAARRHQPGRARAQGKRRIGQTQEQVVVRPHRVQTRQQTGE